MSLSPLNKDSLAENGQYSSNQSLSVSDRQKITLKRLERYAKLLDSQFTLPGTSIRFGWDAIIGLVPGFGDLLSFGLSVLLLLEAKMVGAPLRLLVRMFVNVFVEMIVGIVPVFGDVFDVYWKANVRNIEILRNHLEEIGEEAPAKSRRRWLMLYYLLFLLIIGYFIYLGWMSRDYIFSLI